MRVTENQSYIEQRNVISFDLICFLESVGLTPLLIPNNLKDIELFLNTFEIDGVILSGGNNINPRLYNNDDGLDDVYDERDSTETLIVEYAIDAKLPILGICRGFHFLNIFFGGSLENHIEGHVNQKHRLNSTNKEFNSQIVNSYHNQGILEEGLGKSLDPLARSGDNFIEAFEHKQLDILAIQWHPERNPTSFDSNLVKNFFNKVIKTH